MLSCISMSLRLLNIVREFKFPPIPRTSTSCHFHNYWALSRPVWHIPLSFSGLAEDVLSQIFVHTTPQDVLSLRMVSINRMAENWKLHGFFSAARFCAS